MSRFGLVDDVIPEPLGGAHNDPEKMAEILKEYLSSTIRTLSAISPDHRVDQRITKLSAMGFYDEVIEHQPAAIHE
jgi:acetyl-CoA carboxylase carboxyl transferase subunit alpha